MITGNPNHPVVQALDDQWHKLAAIVLFKYRDVLPNTIVITGADIEAFIRSGLTNIVAHDRRDGMHLSLVNDDDGMRLAREAGGLPS